MNFPGKKPLSVFRYSNYLPSCQKSEKTLRIKKHLGSISQKRSKVIKSEDALRKKVFNRLDNLLTQKEVPCLYTGLKIVLTQYCLSLCQDRVQIMISVF